MQKANAGTITPYGEVSEQPESPHCSAGSGKSPLVSEQSKSPHRSNVSGKSASFWRDAFFVINPGPLAEPEVHISNLRVSPGHASPTVPLIKTWAEYYKLVSSLRDAAREGASTVDLQKRACALHQEVNLNTQKPPSMKAKSTAPPQLAAQAKVFREAEHRGYRHWTYTVGQEWANRKTPPEFIRGSPLLPPEMRFVREEAQEEQEVPHRQQEDTTATPKEDGTDEVDESI